MRTIDSRLHEQPFCGRRRRLCIEGTYSVRQAFLKLTTKNTDKLLSFKVNINFFTLVFPHMTFLRLSLLRLKAKLFKTPNEI